MTGQAGGRVRAVLLPDLAAINLLLSGKSGDLRRTMAGFASVATREARALADQRLKPGTGAYKRSIHATFPRPDTFHLTADTAYAATLELGSRGHQILGTIPPNYRLYFYWEKRQIFWGGHIVNHPGNRKPRRILTDAIQEAARRIGF